MRAFGCDCGEETYRASTHEVVAIVGVEFEIRVCVAYLLQALRKYDEPVPVELLLLALDQPPPSLQRARRIGHNLRHLSRLHGYAENETELLDYDKRALGCAGVITSPFQNDYGWLGLVFRLPSCIDKY